MRPEQPAREDTSSSRPDSTMHQVPGLRTKQIRWHSTPRPRSQPTFGHILNLKIAHSARRVWKESPFVMDSFTGPGTWFRPDGDAAHQVLEQRYPIAGWGLGVWSWVHVEDAAAATVAALECPAGVYNVVDDDPSVMSVWLPAFAASVGAPEPQHISEREALDQAGPDAVYYATQLRGASNAKARRDLGFAPRRLEWLARTKTASRA